MSNNLKKLLTHVGSYLILISVYCMARYLEIYQTKLLDNEVSASEEDIYKQGDGRMVLRKNCTSSAFEFLASGGVFILPLPFLMLCLFYL